MRKLILVVNAIIFAVFLWSYFVYDNIVDFILAMVFGAIFIFDWYRVMNDN